MRYARPSRHYRVAGKQAKKNSLNGTFVPKKDQPKIMVATGFVGVLIFLLGLLLGVLVDKD